MKLREELEILTCEVKEATQPYVLQALEKIVSDLKKANFTERTLKAGDIAHNFSLPDEHGNIISLNQLLLEGPVIVVFYRGGWCPYCNLTLRAWQKVLPDIHALGGQIVAISPEKPENMLKTVKKNKLDLIVLTDENSEVGSQFGVSFVLPSYLKRLYQTFGLKLDKYNNAKTVELPIPATFLIDSQQIIQYAFTDADYTQRADPDEFLAALSALKKEEFVYC